MAAHTCIVCRDPIGDDTRFVLVRNRRHEAHCSEACLVANVEKQRRLRAAVHRRWTLRVSAAVFLVAGVQSLWHHHRLPQSQSISFDPPQIRDVPVRPDPTYYGPAWPPTDADWLFAFANTTWTYPLPGPARRAATVDDRILGGREPAARAAPVCRTPGRCGADLGGDLWGEHVYAVHDGVVDRVQHAPGDEQGGVYLRIAHFDGMVFTHYVHLAAVPRRMVRGAAIKAGEVIGLVGETGNEHTGRYIHFALSVRPAKDFPDVYWDPTPLMVDWPMRQPPHGTVAGFLPPKSDLELPPLHRRASQGRR